MPFGDRWVMCSLWRESGVVGVVPTLRELDGTRWVCQWLTAYHRGDSLPAVRPILVG